MLHVNNVGMVHSLHRYLCQVRAGRRESGIRLSFGSHANESEISRYFLAMVVKEEQHFIANTQALYHIYILTN